MARTGLGKKAVGGLTLLQACLPAAGAARLCVTCSQVHDCRAAPSRRRQWGQGRAQVREQRALDQGRDF